MRRDGALLRALALAAALASVPQAAVGQVFTFSVDYPTTLAGSDYMANQTIDLASSDPSYSLRFDGAAHGLEADVSIDALALLPGGDFLFSTRYPLTVGGTTFAPHDVARFHAAADLYSTYLAGFSLGLSESADIDALALDSQGRLLISLAVPESVAGNDYAANDVILVSGTTLSLAISGAAIGLPPDLNVTGYESDATGDLFMFDQPVTLGATSFTPADVARHSAGAWTAFFHDPAFPEDRSGADFSLPCTGPAFTGSLTASRSSGTTAVSWTAGGAALFDLLRGDLNVLDGDCNHDGIRGDCAGGNFQAALDAITPSFDVCMANDAAAFVVTDTRPDPSPSRGEFYLVRAVAGCGAGGSWNDGTQAGDRDPGIAAGANDCP